MTTTYDYKLIQVTIDSGVAWATINNPPLNIITRELYKELYRFVKEVEVDDNVRALVFQSANPDFFIAHFDVELILRFPTESRPVRSVELTRLHSLCESLRTMGKPTIVKMVGRAGGGGSEMAASCDMRFGVLGRTIINQMEVPIGVIPGGSGTQRLPRIMGRARALEFILGGIDLDAATAERWGYLNRVFDTEEMLNTYVDDLALRIASFSPKAVRLAKEAVGYTEPNPIPGLIDEYYLFDVLIRTPEARVAMQSFLNEGGQTMEGELKMGELNAKVRWK